ncbi:bacillolysin precursor [bacterium BMS3Bbin04]|nr:bacillolysin precursor [bacterium BMS3Bbin04]
MKMRTPISLSSFLLVMMIVYNVMGAPASPILPPRLSITNNPPVTVNTWYDINEPTSTLSSEGAAREFIERHPYYFGGENVISNLELLTVRSSRGGTHLRFRQVVNGIPVYHAELWIHLDGQREVTAVTHTLSDLSTITLSDATLSSDEARFIAAQYIGGRSPASIPRTDLMIYLDPPLEQATLAWVVQHSSADPLGDWELVIDATTGDILRIDNRMAFHTGEGLVFNPDPLTTAEAWYFDPGFIDNNDADSPELNAELIPALLQDITYRDNLYWLEGPYVEIADFEAPSIEPVSSATLNGFEFNRSEDGFEDVCAYFHIDEMQRHLRSLGFTDLQDAPITVDAHASNGQDMSYYSAEHNRLGFGEGGVDDAEDADVLRHEYGHALHHDAVGGEVWGVDIRSIAEGISDYWAASLSSRVSDFNEEWVYNWDGHNEFWGGRDITTDDIFPDDWSVDLYENGTIWAHALWLIHEQLDPDDTDALIAQSLYYMTPGLTPEDAAQGLLQAEEDLFDGLHRAVVYGALLQKGFVEEVGSLSGIITDELTGNPVENAEVSVDTGLPFSGISNELGEYQILDIPVGNWPVTATMTGYGDALLNVQIDLDQTTTQDIILSPVVAFLDIESLNVHTYIQQDVDTSFALNALSNLYWQIRAEPVGLEPPEPYEFHDIITPFIPAEGDIHDLTFMRGRFYLTHTTADDEFRVYVLDTNGQLAWSFLQPVSSAEPFHGLTTDGDFLYAIDANTIVGFDSLGVITEVIDSVDPDNRWLTYDPVLDWFWAAIPDGIVTPYQRPGGQVWDSYDTGMTLTGIAMDVQREDRYRIVLLENDGQSPPVVHHMLPGYGTLSEDTQTLFPFEAVETAGASVFTSVGTTIDYKYFATLIGSANEQSINLYRIRWTIPYLSFEPMTGYLLSNDSEEIEVLADASNLDTGIFQSVLKIFFPSGGTPLELPYQLEITGVDASTISSPAKPGQFTVSQPSPNPCNAATVLNISLPQAGEITLTIYDILGRQIDHMTWQQAAGNHRLTWMPGDEIASGMYLLRVAAEGNAPALRKVVVVK